MIYIVVSLFNLLRTRKKCSITKILFLFLLFSSLSAYLVGRQPSLSVDVTIYVVFTITLLSILFSSFKEYSDVRGINTVDIREDRLKSLERFVVILGFTIFIVNVYILYNVISLLIVGNLTVQEHKNEGAAAEIFSMYVPSIIISISNLLSPLGYFFLTLHFYYLIKNRIKKTALYFLLSLLITLSGLLALSRSSATQYVMVYLVIFVFISPLINSKIKKRITLMVCLCMLVIGALFFMISESRFSERYTKQSLNESILDPYNQPLLFSILDYFSQWQENGPIIMEMHKPEYCFLGLYNSSGLAVHIQKIIYGASEVNDKRDNTFHKILGYQKSKFHGNIARLIYDFGFIGSFLFILFYAYIIRKLQPNKGIISFRSILYLPVILPFCVVFFAGNALSSLSLNLAIIYTLVIDFLLVRKKHGNYCRNQYNKA